MGLLSKAVTTNLPTRNIIALLKIVGRGMSEVGTAVQFRKEFIATQQSGGGSVELQLKRMREVNFCIFVVLDDKKACH